MIFFNRNLVETRHGLYFRIHEFIGNWKELCFVLLQEFHLTIVYSNLADGSLVFYTERGLSQWPLKCFSHKWATARNLCIDFKPIRASSDPPKCGIQDAWRGKQNTEKSRFSVLYFERIVIIWISPNEIENSKYLSWR